MVTLKVKRSARRDKAKEILEDPPTYFERARREARRDLQRERQQQRRLSGRSAEDND